ncbi:MAG: glycerophosphodiester phosphodiesterase [Candidatus Kryptoniota bacterium]
MLSLFKDKIDLFIVGHRGFSAIAPENTIASFRKAIEAGANMIEMDVMMSSDGGVFVFHDYKLGRTTNGSGLLRRVSKNYIRELDAGSWFSKSFAGERVPFLEEVIELARSSLYINIEIKHKWSDGLHELVDKTVQLVEKHQMMDSCIFSSFNLEALRYLHFKYPDAKFGPLYRHNLNPTARSFPLKYNAQAVMLNHHFLNSRSVERLHEHGLKVMVYTVNSANRIEKLIKMGVDGIISDDPALVRRIARRVAENKRF